MKKFVLLLFFFSVVLFSQELPPPVPSPVRITDDYGPRNVNGVYDWHRGIDYRASSGTDIKAVEGGSIVFIRSGGGGGWRIRINGAHAFWTYMHMFSDDSNPTSGDWEAIRDTLIDPNTGQPSPLAPEPIFIQWADREQGIARRVLSSYGGRRIRHNGDYIMDEHGDTDTMLTSGSIGDQDTVGPAGNSGTRDAHLHISAGSSNEFYGDINPLYHIIHDISDYSLNIIKPAVNDTFFHVPGVSESQQLQERMKDSIISSLGGVNSQDLDQVFIYLFDPDTTRVYNEAHRYGIICYGGPPPGKAYADPFPRDRMVHKRDNSARGSLTRTGVDPRDHPPLDPSINNFYLIGGFSEKFSGKPFHFNSRLNKAETKDAILNKWAANPAKIAKFKDGWTDMVIRARNVRGTLIDSTERRILLDNFVPYVYAVMVTRGNEVVHNAMWLLNSIKNTLVFDEKISKNVLPGETLKFKIYFSEIMDTTTIEVKLKKDGKELEIDDNEEWIDKMTWEGSVTIPKDNEDWKEGDAVVNITCKDLAGHMLDINPGTIAYRKKGNEWEKYEDKNRGGSDINHELYIGEAPIVVSTDPTDKAEEVPVDKETISIGFSKSMDQNIAEEALSIISEEYDTISFNSLWKDTITLQISPLDTFDYCMNRGVRS